MARMAVILAIAFSGPALPTAEQLKVKAGFDGEHLQKAATILAEFAPKVKEAADHIRGPNDKRPHLKTRALRAEAMARLRELCRDDVQRKKFTLDTPDRRMAGEDDVRLADLAAGHRLHLKACTKCHPSPLGDPFDHDEIFWIAKAGLLRASPALGLSVEEVDRVFLYLKAATVPARS